MLCSLTIHNFKLIDRLECDFGPGLNVLTGETGAGKSILLKALALLFGQPAERNLFRNPEQPLQLSAVFSSPTDPDLIQLATETGFFNDDTLPAELIFRRRLILNRRGAISSRAYLNDQPVTNQTLSRYAARLFEFVDQHQQQRLRTADEARHLLDTYAGLDSRLAEYRHLFSRYREERRTFAEWQQAIEAAARELDYYRYQLAELKKVDLDPDQERELRTELARFHQLGRLEELTRQAIDLSYAGEHSLIDNCYRFEQILEELKKHDPDAPFADNLLTPILDTLQECHDRLVRYHDGLTFDEEEIRTKEEQLAHLEQLKRKFATDTAGLARLRDEFAAKLEGWENRAQEETRRRQRLENAKKELEQAASELSRERRQAAARMAAEVTRRLKGLNLPHARFAVKIEESGELQRHGTDRITLLFTANPGEKPSPLNKTASGGELSRLLLALKSTVASRYRVPTLIFDEVDTGLGGGTAAAVGNEIAAIASRHQVLAVTHLPQVAAYAEHHLLIHKLDDKQQGSSRIEVRRLPADQEEERVAELARMSSGSRITRSATEHARALLAEAQRRKSARKHPDPEKAGNSIQSANKHQPQRKRSVA